MTKKKISQEFKDIIAAYLAGGFTLFGFIHAGYLIPAIRHDIPLLGIVGAFGLIIGVTSASLFWDLSMKWATTKRNTT